MLFIKVDFVLTQTAQFDKCINLFRLVFLTFEFYIKYSLKVSGIFISFFISLYPLQPLFAEIKSSSLIYESIKALKVKISIVVTSCNNS